MKRVVGIRKRGDLPNKWSTINILQKLMCDCVCRNISRLWFSCGAALSAASPFGRVVGPPTASRRYGPSVPWVSLPGRTGVMTHAGG